ncbi:hypothetical protein J6590_028015 [Homalodisca vitripennis]|nr:hypothetical protein J6590_028015 [Homalodisca vitripennis]
MARSALAILGLRTIKSSAGVRLLNSPCITVTVCVWTRQFLGSREETCVARAHGPAGQISRNPTLQRREPDESPSRYAPDEKPRCSISSWRIILESFTFHRNR